MLAYSGADEVLDMPLHAKNARQVVARSIDSVEGVLAGGAGACEDQKVIAR